MNEQYNFYLQFVYSLALLNFANKSRPQHRTAESAVQENRSQASAEFRLESWNGWIDR